MIKRQYFSGEIKKGNKVSTRVFDKVRANFVIATVDVLIVNNKNQCLLGYRQQSPINIWWIFGGRMFSGESFEQAAQRALNKELGLSVLGDNLKHIGFYSLYWDDKKVDHALLVAYVYEINKSQKVKTPEGHSESKWFNLKEIKYGDFHPALKQIVSDYQSQS